MTATMTEKDRQIILAVPTAQINRTLTGSGLLPLPESLVWAHLDGPCWVARGPAEHNEALLQVIPYILVTVGPHVSRFLLTYRRPGGGEGRLTGRRSAGFGGHVEMDDQVRSYEPGVTDRYGVAAAVKAAALRELAEELTGLDPCPGRLSVLGLIDARNCLGAGPVERVHLGVLMHYNADGQVAGALSGDGTSETRWRRLPGLEGLDDDAECWTRIVADAIRRGVLAP